MNTVTYTAFRQNLATLMNKVSDDHMPLLITRQNAAPAVLLSLEDFKAFGETAYLMASPRNAQSLDAAINELRQGKGTVHEIIEP
ncbi:MAG: type II toxin-antitoxin system Phd/YefM family antitoxin [Holosporales bacterium]|jgi:antitoxin YefM